MTLSRVHDAYTRRAMEYIDALGSIERAAERDRDDIRVWALSVDGLILDVGCGPGQWTDYLRRVGCAIEGLDPVEVFIKDAQRRYPESSYRVGRAESLGVAEASLGGVLAWFSLIHTEPEHIGNALGEFARCLAPGGSLLLGFFDGDARTPFDHAVTTAYYWSASALSACLDEHGFTVNSVETRTDAGTRPQGRIIAIKAQPPSESVLFASNH